TSLPLPERRPVEQRLDIPLRQRGHRSGGSRTIEQAPRHLERLLVPRPRRDHARDEQLERRVVPFLRQFEQRRLRVPPHGGPDAAEHLPEVVRPLGAFLWHASRSAGASRPAPPPAPFRACPRRSPPPCASSTRWIGQVRSPCLARTLRAAA